MGRTSFTDCSPIFVVGSGRSGTTLLQLMLNAHPAIAITGELHFFDQILGLKKRVPDLETRDQIDELFRLLPSTAGFKYLNEFEPVLADARDRLLAADRPGYELLYRSLLEGFGRQQGARRFGEKTAINLRYLEQLVRIFPSCKIIHIVRNPHATVASRLKVPWTSGDVLTNALKWRLEVACGRLFANRRALAQGRFLEVRYEDLVMEPAPTLQRVCGFLDEDYDERMLDYHRSASAFVEREPWKSGTKRPVYTSSLEGWRKDLTGSQIFLIGLLARKEMKHYGYPRCEVSFSSVLLSPWQIVRELLRWFDYKRTERRQREMEGFTVYGDNRRLLHILWRAFVR